MQVFFAVLTVLGIIVAVSLVYFLVAVATCRFSYRLASRGKAWLSKDGNENLSWRTFSAQAYIWDWDDDVLYRIWGGIWPAFWLFVLPFGYLLHRLSSGISISKWIERDEEALVKARQERKERREERRTLRRAPQSLKQIEKELEKV